MTPRKTAKRVQRSPRWSQDQLRLDEDRVAEILEIAAEIFISQGFEGASINAIAKRANASKTTFYSRFPSKKELFLAVLERRMNLIFNQVATALPLDPPVEATLKEFGSRLLRLALSKEQVALLRVVSMESKRFPELGERFYELGPGRGLRTVRHYLEEQIKRGRLVSDDPAIMAEHLSSLLTGGLPRWFVLGLTNHLNAKERRWRVDAAVKVFLRAYSADQSREPARIAPEA
jgi:TetR/AcrR family transcriptional regulator, mexJK operon transcriptional repressor